MSVCYNTHLLCDEPECRAEFVFHGKFSIGPQVRQAAEQAGWRVADKTKTIQVPGDLDLCPRCRAKQGDRA